MAEKRPFSDVSNKINGTSISKNKSLKRNLISEDTKVNVKKTKTNNIVKDKELFDIFNNTFSSDISEEKNDDINDSNKDEKSTELAKSNLHERSHIKNLNKNDQNKTQLIGEITNSSLFKENLSKNNVNIDDVFIIEKDNNLNKMEGLSNSKPVPTTELIKKIQEDILLNRKENHDFSSIDLCPSYRHYEIDNNANANANEASANLCQDEELNRFTNVDDLRLRQPIRALNKQTYNRNVSFEKDLKRLIDRIFPILEKKPDLQTKIDMEKFKIPKGILVQLMDHQCRSLEWLKWREEHFPHGAILGKFFSQFIIRLILKNKRNQDICILIIRIHEVKLSQRVLIYVTFIN
jgi:hypothetical protein